MLELNFSIIVPVYNRPEEIEELLDSLTKQTYTKEYEVIIVEDGSELKCDDIVSTYKEKLQIKYLSKPNTGAGFSRNFGMKNASGNYFIILDSDVVLPPIYLKAIDSQLHYNYTDAFGGSDAAHASFSNLQKAINYSMTSFLTTGGLRGSSKVKAKFQPRSFNMGLSKKAFKITQGFSKRKIGEDIDLTFRLWQKDFQTQFIEDAFVYHKRRTSFKQFFKQTYNFGKERPVLNREYPNTAKLTYWFPSIFTLGLLFSFICLFLISKSLFCIVPILGIIFYLATIFVDASFRNKSIRIGLTSLITTIVQFVGYGLGYLKAFFTIKV